MTVKQRIESKISGVSNIEVDNAIERMENVVGFLVLDHSNDVLINRLCKYILDRRTSQ